MKAVVNVLLFVLIVSVARSQSPTFQWVKNFGSPSNDQSKSIDIDNSGNSITVGEFSHVIDFDPGGGIYNLNAKGYADVFILKLNASGNFIWAKSVGGFWDEQVFSVKTDNIGNVYVAGTFRDTVDFDPGIGIFKLSTKYANSDEAFLLKLDQNGNFLWVKQFQSAGIMAIDIDANGNIYSIGSFSNITDFDPGPAVYSLTEFKYLNTGNTSTDAFVLKLDAAGNFLWVKQMGGMKADKGNSLACDASGNINITGDFGGTVDFDPGPGVFNLISASADVFVLQLTSNGNLIWVQNFGGSDLISSRDITVDLSGNMYICGEFNTTVDVDPGAGVYNLTSSSFQGDCYILKLSPSGVFVWAKQFGGTSTELCKAIALDNIGNVYATGYFNKSADFDPGYGTFILTTRNYENAFILKLDNGGNFLWASAIASLLYNDPSSGFDIAIDKSRNVYTVGQFWGTVDFDPGPNSYNVTMNATGDAYIHKLSQCTNVTYSTVNAIVCNSYTLNNQAYDKSGIYTQTTLNANGCDSIITLNLIIGGSLKDTFVISCDNYFWEGQTYAVSGSYRVTYTGADGCDSIRNLNLTIKNKVYANIYDTICNGQNSSGYINTGIYTDTFVAANGCDSIRTLHLKVNQTYNLSINVAICEGDSYANYITSGIYTDTFIATDGCDSIRTLHLTVNPKKTKILKAEICEGEIYTAGGFSQTTAGIYRDTLKTYLGCDSVVITDLVVNPKPKPNLGNDRNICKGDTLSLHPGLFDSYLWQNMSTNTNYITNTAGSYWVTVTNSNNCSATDTMRIKGINPLPVDFLKQTDSVCANEKLIIGPFVNFSSYNWSTGVAQKNILIEKPGQYWLKVVDQNGCYGIDTITVLPKQCLTGVFIPNAFTPDGDGKNDFFKALSFGRFLSYRLQVFERGGQLIFQTTEPNEGWNGSHKGIPFTTSSFVWQCFYQLEGEKPVYKKGTVVLIR